MTELGEISAQQSKVFKETYPFGGRFVHIEINTDNLRQDLLDAADSLSFSKEKAGKFTQNVLFHFGSLDTAPIKPPEHSSRSPYGYVYPYQTPKGEKGYMCGLDIPALVKQALGEKESIRDKLRRVISGKKRSEIYDVPHNSPAEAKELGLKQIMLSVWKHEREHLLQRLTGVKIGDEEDAYEQGRMDKFVPSSLFNITFEK